MDHGDVIRSMSDLLPVCSNDIMILSSQSSLWACDSDFTVSKVSILTLYKEIFQQQPANYADWRLNLLHKCVSAWK